MDRYFLGAGVGIMMNDCPAGIAVSVAVVIRDVVPASIALWRRMAYPDKSTHLGN